MRPSAYSAGKLTAYLLLAAGLLLIAGESRSGPYVYEIADNSDDGTEVSSTWYESGYASFCNTMGRSFAKLFFVGLRYRVPDLEQGQTVKYARLRFPAQGGHVNAGLGLVIKGVDEDSPEPPSAGRLPSALPKTGAVVTWNIAREWEEAGYNLPLFYSGPDIAPVINEILARPGWGSGPEGKTLLLTLEDFSTPAGDINTLYFEDFSILKRGKATAVLEVYPSVGDAFVAPPILGRPTATSITVNALNLLSIDFYIDYGTQPGQFDFYTIPVTGHPAGEPIEVTVYGLTPDQDYYYRVRYREAGVGAYEAWPGGTFHTQRPPGSEFTFTIQADAQIHDALYDEPEFAEGCSLYTVALANALLDTPDFHLDMGDLSNTDLRGRDAMTMEEALDRYLVQRRFIGQLAHSTSFFFVLGNHEGEHGWRAMNEADSLEVWSTCARKQVVPNPAPNAFYTGSQDATPGCGLRENYYAWRWGDALFVVLDPFWYTTTKPHNYFDDGYTGSNDAWDWTLGEDQYNWLYDTLHNSDAAWKFVFSHHMTGGVMSGGMFPTPYGRGGIEAAKFRVDSLPTYEWGGENAAGEYVFDVKRPGWSHGPVHDIFVSEGVDIFFHGHDHIFAKQDLDGVVYQTCPVPWDPDYSEGFLDQSNYKNGVIHENSGHLRVTVYPEGVKVEYVRAVLPEDEPITDDGVPVYNRDVFCTYYLGSAGVPDRPRLLLPARLLPPSPNPSAGSVTLGLEIPAVGRVRLEVFDTRGRLVRVLADRVMPVGFHRIEWDGAGLCGRRAAPGVYYCRLEAGGHTETRKIAFLR
jgi:hypothetical protein